MVVSSINHPVREFALIFSLIISTSFLVFENSWLEKKNFKKSCQTENGKKSKHTRKQDDLYCFLPIHPFVLALRICVALCIHWHSAQWSLHWHVPKMAEIEKAPCGLILMWPGQSIVLLRDVRIIEKMQYFGKNVKFSESFFGTFQNKRWA